MTDVVLLSQVVVALCLVASDTSLHSPASWPMPRIPIFPPSLCDRPDQILEFSQLPLLRRILSRYIPSDPTCFCLS